MTTGISNPDGVQAALESEWSHVRETVRMIELSGGQIEAAMTDSNSSVQVLTDVFTTMADNMRTISETIAALPDEGAAGDAKNSLTGTTEQVSGMVHQAIIAFQFYDKLAQRLVHVNQSLAALSDLVSDESRLHNPQEWTALQEKIRSKYTMREEIEMFEAVLGGMPVKDALDQFMNQMKDHSDDIELF
ncbi:MAG TPA: hypothetical protein VFW53_11315 [Gallionella sp.]|nr:hypothetical protein [Gallionella sp.]